MGFLYAGIFIFFVSERIHFGEDFNPLNYESSRIATKAWFWHL